jgi:NADH-quinone oxidoreductase E subunit
MAMGTVEIEAILERHPHARRESLISILQEVQEEYGYISKEAVTHIGRRLKLPTSKIYGVATFYNQVRFQPLGQFHVQVCRGTACHVKGSAAVLEAVERALHVQPGQTTREGLFSLEVVACMGACGLSPVMNINGEFYAKMTPKKVSRILQECREKGTAHAKR